MFLPTRRASGTRVDDERSPGHGDTDGDSPSASLLLVEQLERERRGGERILPTEVESLYHFCEQSSEHLGEKD